MFLWAYGLAIALPNGVLSTPLASLLVLGVGPPALFLLGAAAAAKFASTFPSGNELPTPRVLANVAVGLAPCNVIALLAVELWPSVSLEARRAVAACYACGFVVVAFLFAVTLTIAYVNGEPSERQRRRWVFLTLGVGIAALLVDATVQATLGFRQCEQLRFCRGRR